MYQPSFIGYSQISSDTEYVLIGKLITPKSNTLSKFMDLKCTSVNMGNVSFLVVNICLTLSKMLTERI